MKKKSNPNPRVGSFNQHNADNNKGEFKVIDMSSGVVVIQQRFMNVKASDNVIGLIGICRAWQYCIEHNYIGPVYSSNFTTFNWAIKQRYKTKVTSSRITKLLEENLPTLSLHDFGDVITFWPPEYGCMRDAINSIRNKAAMLEDRLP